MSSPEKISYPLPRQQRRRRRDQKRSERNKGGKQVHLCKSMSHIKYMFCVFGVLGELITAIGGVSRAGVLKGRGGSRGKRVCEVNLLELVETTSEGRMI